MLTVFFPSYGFRHPPPCGRGRGKPRRAHRLSADPIRSVATPSGRRPSSSAVRRDRSRRTADGRRGRHGGSGERTGDGLPDTAGAHAVRVRVEYGDAPGTRGTALVRFSASTM
ncbi:hypothetical protein GCM10010358_30730 [Streptomyces minutiscleroticus]|uniref:Uncharacterized protein n=1 Tax=Streptomyces minutiscleroticus TaxID=68238 RepID=A0A918KRL3_9ACTN|nr:hypothetical protein GCM10010358_30730 [Streptomyces minutiscleroticus]